MKNYFSLILAALIVLSCPSVGFAIDDKVRLECVEGHEHVFGFTVANGVCWRLDVICAINGTLDFAIVDLVQWDMYDVLLEADMFTFEPKFDCHFSNTTYDGRRVSGRCDFIDGSRFSATASVVNAKLCED